MYGNFRNLSVDAIDRLIIDQLRIEGRQSFAMVGDKVGLSEPTVRTRYNRLAKLGIMQVVGMVNPTKVGEIECHLFLKIIGRSVKKVADALCEMPEVTYVAQCVGEFDLALDVRCIDETHLEMTLAIIQNLHGVDAVENFRVKAIAKETYLWEGLRV